MRVSSAMLRNHADSVLLMTSASIQPSGSSEVAFAAKTCLV